MAITINTRKSWSHICMHFICALVIKKYIINNIIKCNLTKFIRCACMRNKINFVFYSKEIMLILCIFSMCVRVCICVWKFREKLSRTLKIIDQTYMYALALCCISYMYCIPVQTFPLTKVIVRVQKLTYKIYFIK